MTRKYNIIFIFFLFIISGAFYFLTKEKSIITEKRINTEKANKNNETVLSKKEVKSVLPEISLVEENRESEKEKFNLERLANGFTSKELKLIGEAHQKKLNQQIVIEFILKSRDIEKTDENLLKIANKISKNDFITKIELVRWIRMNYSDEKKSPPSTSPLDKKTKKLLDSFQINKAP